MEFIKPYPLKVLLVVYVVSSLTSKNKSEHKKADRM